MPFVQVIAVFVQVILRPGVGVVVCLVTAETAYRISDYYPWLPLSRGDSNRQLFA